MKKKKDRLLEHSFGTQTKKLKGFKECFFNKTIFKEYFHVPLFTKKSFTFSTVHTSF